MYGCHNPVVLLQSYRIVAWLLQSINFHIGCNVCKDLAGVIKVLP